MQEPDPKSREAAAMAAEEREAREARLRDLTEQCLELMDRLAEAGRERDRLRERCAEIEDELARSQSDTVVSRERIAWLEEVLSQMHRTSEHIQVQDLQDLKRKALEAAGAGAAGDLEERFERLGQGIDLEHQIKSALVNVVNKLRGEAEAARGEAEAARGEAEAARTEAEAARREAEAARADVSALAARADAAVRDQERIRGELEQELSSREADLERLREHGTTVRELRVLLGASDSESGKALVEWIRNLQSVLRDRDRWVAALLSELAGRRLKLTRRGLMEHERKFLADHHRARGS